VRAENLPKEQREKLVRDGYLVGTQGAIPSVGALTVTAAGMMACALLGMLDDDADRLPQAYVFDPLFGDTFHPPAETRDKCICHLSLGRGLGAPLGLS
jgi:hypothetical protein